MISSGLVFDSSVRGDVSPDILRSSSWRNRASSGNLNSESLGAIEVSASGSGAVDRKSRRGSSSALS